MSDATEENDPSHSCDKDVSGWDIHRTKNFKKDLKGITDEDDHSFVVKTVKHTIEQGFTSIFYREPDSDAWRTRLKDSNYVVGAVAPLDNVAVLVLACPHDAWVRSLKNKSKRTGLLTNSYWKEFLKQDDDVKPPRKRARKKSSYTRAKRSKHK